MYNSPPFETQVVHGLPITPSMVNNPAAVGRRRRLLRPNTPPPRLSGQKGGVHFPAGGLEPPDPERQSGMLPLHHTGGCVLFPSNDM
jgi:hypothetical protein